MDLPALQTEYPDIKGWISIPGTCVDYPVLQSSADDPEYYLRRTYKGEWRTAGSIFFNGIVPQRVKIPWSTGTT